MRTRPLFETTHQNGLGFRASYFGGTMKSLIAALVIALSVLTGQAARADLQDGWVAYEAGDYATALSEFRLLARQQSAEAQYALGMMADEGYGVPLDDAKAAMWYLLAANQSFAEAEYALGLMYYFGEGVSHDLNAAAEWFRQASDQGMAEAHYALGVMYREGESVALDLEMAVSLFELAADQGQPNAQFALGLFYDEGLGVPLDDEKAFNLFYASATQGYENAQHAVGLMYLFGEGVAEDRGSAIDWLERAAAQGMTEAQDALAGLTTEDDAEGSQSADDDGAPHAPSESIEARLETVKRLLDNGLVTTEEAAAQRRMILSELSLGSASASTIDRGSAATITDHAPPVITTPGSLETAGSTVVIAGTITDSSVVSNVWVAGSATPVDGDGRFSVTHKPPPGASEIEVTAIDEHGNRAEQRVSIVRRAIDLDLGPFTALVIGNNTYEQMPALQTAVADAESVAAVLTEQYGFKVTTLVNATRADIIGSLSRLRASTTYNDNLLIYYAGHGVIDPLTESGFWLPVDAAPDDPTNWVSNADITNMLKAIPARHLLVIADSCYSGALVRAAPVEIKTWEDRVALLQRLAEKRSRTALASGGLEPVLDSGGGRHSVFAKALLEVLAENTAIIDAQSLFRPVRERVVVNANQTPQYSDVRLSGHEGGDFIFQPLAR